MLAPSAIACAAVNTCLNGRMACASTPATAAAAALLPLQAVKDMLQRVRGDADGAYGDSIGDGDGDGDGGGDGGGGGSGISEERLLELMKLAGGDGDDGDGGVGGELALDMLSEEERRAFFRAVHSGSLSR
jgi:hypothetical protein